MANDLPFLCCATVKSGQLAIDRQNLGEAFEMELRIACE